MTEYSNYINEVLKPDIQEQAVVLDLFAGCGGLSLGFEAAGFRTIGYEMSEPAVETYNKNLKGKCNRRFLTVGFEYPEAENIDIVIGVHLANLSVVSAIKKAWKTQGMDSPFS